MLSNLVRLPYRMLLESGDCTNARFSPDFARNITSKPLIIEGDFEVKDERLHPVNRLFSFFDPEMWEISPDARGASGRRIVFPLHFINRLLQYLKPDNLKTCRLVSKQWNHTIISSRKWKSNLVAVINGTKSKWGKVSPTSIGYSCASFINNSKNRFSFWTEMRLVNLKPKTMISLLTVDASSFGRSVKHIRKLTFQKCNIFWQDFLELLYHFRSLEKLELRQCCFNTQTSMTDNFLVSIGAKFPPRFQEILEGISEKCPSSDYFMEKLKILHIFEDDCQSEMMMPLLLSLLKTRTGQMDEFEVHLGRSTSFLKESTHQNHLWQSIHSFLAQKNVLRCVIKSNHTVSSGLVNRFFSYMNLWKFPPRDDEIWRLTHLIIELRPLVLWSSFERHLIPLVQRLPELNVLTIRNIVLRGNKSHFIKELIEHCDEKCQLEIGLILDDQGGVASLTQDKDLLSTQLYQKHLSSIEVIVHTDAIREIRDLIPDKTEYSAVQEFIFSTHGQCRPRFFSLNINMIVHNFPNLVELRIIDGPPFQYGSIFTNYLLDGQWKDMSGAVVGDDDIQLLLKNLKNLTKFVLRANMKYLTDSGFTGLSGVYCRKVSKVNLCSDKTETTKLTALEPIHRDGVSFANLSKLKYLSMEGIGPGVSDVTAFLGFRDFNSLTYLGLFGSHQISIRGKEFLQCTLSKGCKIVIT